MRHNGCVARVVLGELNGLHSPLAGPTPLRLIDLELAPGAHCDMSLALGETAALFMLGGTVGVGHESVRAGQLGLTSRDSTSLTIESAEGARLTMFCGMPLNQSRVQHGPFVGSNAAELHTFIRAHAAGGFGRLTPFAEQA